MLAVAVLAEEGESAALAEAVLADEGASAALAVLSGTAILVDAVLADESQVHGQILFFLTASGPD